MLVTRQRRRPRLAAAVACALGALVLSGCHASTTVAIRVRADGRGTVAVGVTLDRAARLALAGAALHPGATAPDVPLGDMKARGWSVSAWRSASGGGASIALSKSFVGRAGLASALADLDGPDGALRDAKVERTRSLLHDHDGVSLVADLSHLHVGVADDHLLATRLRAAGINVAALDTGLQSQLAGSFALTVRVELPNGSHTTVHLVPGQTRTIALASSSAHPGRRLALVAAAAAAVLGLALLVVAAIAARAARPRRA